MTAQLCLTPIGRHRASSLHYTPAGAPLHFYHANGFGAACYQPFLQRIAPHYTVSALDMRPLWPTAPQPDRRFGWAQYADDLIAWLDATATGPTLAVAHSMGAAATAMAALKRPDLFSGLVLIEPSGIPRRLVLMMRLLPYDVRLRLGPAKELHSRPGHWPDTDSLYREFRANRAYRRFSDDRLHQLVLALTEAGDMGRHLRFPLAWEAHNYASPAEILPVLKRLAVPTRIIAAKPSLFLDPAILARLQKARPDLPVTHLPEHGHLLPLEAPEVAADKVLAALGDLSRGAASATNAA
ncbi:alpha/beta fold hydrolase [Shimia sp.]|uniref:alpha/beta fold hydrolase n=1 Tax=Shimia sp. TaxID=1954381 RepID=UPI003566C9C6